MSMERYYPSADHKGMPLLVCRRATMPQQRTRVNDERAEIAKNYAGHAARFSNSCNRHRRCLLGWLHHGLRRVRHCTCCIRHLAACTPGGDGPATGRAGRGGGSDGRHRYGTKGVRLGTNRAVSYRWRDRRSARCCRIGGSFAVSPEGDHWSSIAYATYQLFQRHKREIGRWGGNTADGLIGVGGGFLGGFAGLSGPLPLIWLQLRGRDSASQRATYQPFNVIMLALASVGMSISGQITSRVLWIALLCLPATLIGAWIGARIYVGVSARTFRSWS